MRYWTNVIIVTLILTISTSTFGQSPEDVIYRFFEAMHAVDTVELDQLLDEDCHLVTTYTSKDGNVKVEKGDKQAMLANVARMSKGDLSEKITNLRTEKHDGLANVWMDYTFYYRGTLSHCGVNNFTLVRSAKTWKIISIADTRSKDNCKFDQDVQKINSMIDAWHLAAAKADSSAYFGLMTETAIFVGTDKSEVWSKGDFLEFAAPYFAKGKAWDFEKMSRNVYIQETGKTAWFDEVLDTWMGPCRGSGVAVYQGGKWMLQHYVLSVTVPNDDVKEFLKIYDPSELRSRKSKG